MTDTEMTMTPEQQLALERMECVCRECHKSPTSRRQRSYCASCGKPLAWPAGTTPLPRAEALAKAREEERARCAEIAAGYDAAPLPVQARRMAWEIHQAILKD